MWFRMPANQVSCTAAGAPVVDPLFKCSAYASVAGESQIVVAAEVQQLAPVYLQRVALGAFDNSPVPIAVLPLALPKALLHIAETGQFNSFPLQIYSSGDPAKGYHLRRRAHQFLEVAMRVVRWLGEPGPIGFNRAAIIDNGCC